MKNRNTLTFIGIAIATTALALGTSSIAQKSTNQEKATVSSPSGLKPKPTDEETSRPLKQDQETQDQTIPEHIVYDQMFRHMKELKKKATEDELQGKDGEHFRTLYKRLAKLEDHQAQELNRIADDVNRQVEVLDKKAINIIRKVRGQHPDGKLAQGELPPSPPAELRGLSDQRRDVILHARESLRASFGAEAFQKFDEFVQQRIKPGIRRVGDSSTATPAGGAK